MWLEEYDQPAAGVAGTGGGQCSRDFGGVMCVVVYNGYAAACPVSSKRRWAPRNEASAPPIAPSSIPQRVRNYEGRRRVGGIMPPAQQQLERAVVSVRPFDRESRTTIPKRDIAQARICIARLSVPLQPAVELRSRIERVASAALRVVRTGDNNAPLENVAGKAGEGAADTLLRAEVIKVISLDVRDDRNLWMW